MLQVLTHLIQYLYYIDLKVEVDKQDIDKSVNVSNNFFKKVNDLCVDKLTLLLPVDLKSKN